MLLRDMTYYCSPHYPGYKLPQKILEISEGVYIYGGSPKTPRIPHDSHAAGHLVHTIGTQWHCNLLILIACRLHSLQLV